MKRSLPGLPAVLLFFLLTLPIIAAPSGNNAILVGIWEGKLTLPGMSLRIVFHITANEKAELSALMDSPDQGAKGIKVDKVSLTEKAVTLDLHALRGEYKGELSGDGKTMKGTWTQGGTSFPLDLSKTEKVSELKRPQVPVKPYPYKEEEVRFVNNKDGDTLAGTFTYPATGKNFPVVVFVTGSGPQNRDEELLGHKPFLIISDYLTRNGIATLRYDDRGIGKSTGNFSAATSLDFADDALAAVDYLKSRKEIDAARIGIIGHSEGGLIAPIAATRSKDVSFIILMAGPGETGEEIILQQSVLIMKADGAAEAEIQKTVAFSEKIFSIIKEGPDSSTAAGRINAEIKTFMASLPDSVKHKPENTETALKQQMQQVLSPWFRAFLVFNPREYLLKVTCPVLAINGSKDLQVPPKENLGEIRKALEAAGNKHFEIKELEGLNHLFQNAKTGSPNEYGAIEETIAPAALETILTFIKGLK